MSDFDTVPQGVNIYIEGLIVLFFERNQANQIVACEFAVLDQAPGHVRTLEIKMNGAPVTVGTLDRSLRLAVEGPAQTGIIRSNPSETINRITEQGDPQSLRWVLDFEGSELYGRPIGADPNRFSTILRIEHGLIYTKSISANHLLTRLAVDPNEPWTLKGKVATVIGIRIELDQAGSAAEFFNGASSVARAVTGNKLDITLKMSHPETGGEDELHHDADANFYYRAVGQNLTPQELRVFGATMLLDGDGPVAPEASCLPGYMGTTSI